MKKYENLFLLNGLAEEDKKSVISLFPELQKFKKGEIIFSAKSFENAIGYIVKGNAIATNDKSLLLNNFSSGECFGAAAVFNEDASYVTTIKAKTEMEILFLPKEILSKIFALFPKCAENYISFLSSKIRFLNKKLNLISCSNTEDTVFNYIIGIADEDNISILPKNMTNLSKMLGISRASLYRSLDDLEKNGYISRHENKVKVINYEKNC